MPYVITSDCDQCYTCFSGCEVGAIKEELAVNVIDTKLCIECGICADNCPSQAIVFEEESDPDAMTERV